jgi:RNA polymerase sigma-70 factor, ECF subfamily
VNAELQQASDDELARQAQGGSLDAFEDLVFRYERRVYAFVLQLSHNPADAAEVTQETFVKAYRSIGLYRRRHAFAAWLFTIARHKCIDHHRAAPRTSAEPVPETLDANDPAELMATQEDKENLWALARRVLPPAQFQAVWLSYGSELKVEEIARVLHRTQTHIKVMLFRARRTLRRALEESKPPHDSVNLLAGRARRAPRRDLLQTARSASAPYLPE